MRTSITVIPIPFPSSVWLYLFAKNGTFFQARIYTRTEFYRNKNKNRENMKTNINARLFSSCPWWDYRIRIYYISPWQVLRSRGMFFHPLMDCFQKKNNLPNRLMRPYFWQDNQSRINEKTSIFVFAERISIKGHHGIWTVRKTLLEFYISIWLYRLRPLVVEGRAPANVCMNLVYVLRKWAKNKKIDTHWAYKILEKQKLLVQNHFNGQTHSKLLSWNNFSVLNFFLEMFSWRKR